MRPASKTSGLSLVMMSVGRLEGGTFISALRLRTALTASMMSSKPASSSGKESAASYFG